jgi:RNA polymerase sigma-70 factor (ECF subfamily)
MAEVRRHAGEGRGPALAPHDRAEGSGESPAHHPEDVVGTASLIQAFNALDERDREALALVAWDGLAPREAAIVAGCSAATFSVRLHRARKRLTALLNDDGEPLHLTTEEPA